jgi:hypothetical protein
MKKHIRHIFLLVLLTIPSLSFAKGIPLFIQTGDELFEIEGAPTFEDGYKVGYACKRFGILGADIWTWDCNLMAINLDEFAAGDLDQDYKTEIEGKYSLSDRKRNIWNHYGAIALGLFLVGGVAAKSKKE